MNVEHLVLSRFIRLDPAGTTTLTLESGTPYRHLNMWAKAVNEDGSAPNLTAQPMFGDTNDGAATVIIDNNPTKVFQVPVEEVRPPSRGLMKHPDDAAIPALFKSELSLTNGAGVAVFVSVYILAMATPGGA